MTVGPASLVLSLSLKNKTVIELQVLQLPFPLYYLHLFSPTTLPCPHTPTCKILRKLGCRPSWTSLCPKCCFTPGAATGTWQKDKWLKYGSKITPLQILILQSIITYPILGMNQIPDTPGNRNHNIIIPRFYKQLNEKEHTPRRWRLCCSSNYCFCSLHTQVQGTNVDSKLNCNSFIKEKYINETTTTTTQKYYNKSNY